MKTLLAYIILLSLAWQIHAQKQQENWMQSAVLWKSYQQRAEQLLEKDHLHDKEQFLSSNQASHLLNYHPLSNSINIKEEIADVSQMTLFVVYWNQDTTQEQLLWSIADQEKDFLLSTTDRLADLSKYQFLNYLDQPKSLPQIQSYFQHEKEMAAGVLKFGGQPMNASIPVENFKGSIAEIILFRQVLSPLKRQQIQTYLALKYGISLSEDYISGNEIPLKEMKNSDYTYRIAGIAREEVFELHQKQARSSTAELSLSIGLNKIEAENTLNSSELIESTYLIWSDNNRSLQSKQRQILEIPSLERLWEMSVIGEGNTVATELQIDLSKVELDKDQSLYLVIYEDGKKQQRRYYKAEEINQKGVATFRNIQWDSDQSGKDYFSFASGKDLIPNIKIQFPECENNQAGDLELAAIGGQAPYKFELRDESGKLIGKWKLESEEESQTINLAIGDYRLILKDKNGTQYQESFFFQAADAPKHALGNQYFLAENGVLTLNPQLDNPNAKYQWINEAGQLLSDQFWYSFEEEGIYELILEDGGCISKHTIEIIKRNEQNNILDFSLSPNPSTDGHFRLQAQLDQADESQINIYNLNGQLLKTINFDASNFINYQDKLLENGMYLIELQTRKSKATRKLIVQRNY